MNDNKKERWKKLVEEEQKKKGTLVDQEESKPESEPKKIGYVANAPKVNLRTAPSKTSKVIMIVNDKDTFELIDYVDGTDGDGIKYAKVVVPDPDHYIEGYINENYFTFSLIGVG